MTGALLLAPDTSPVLILMTDHHLGNFCLAIPTIDRLARHFTAPPELLLDQRYAPIAKLASMPVRLRPIPVRNRGMVRNLGLGVRLLVRRYAAVIDIGGGVKSATLTAMSGARHRVGLKEFRRSWVYNQTYSREGIPHFSDWYAQMLGCIGVTARPAVVPFRASGDVRSRVWKRIDAAIAPGGRPLLVIHPSAGKGYRRWPAERFAAAADALVRGRDMRVCIIGLPSETAVMDEVRTSMRHAGEASCQSFTLPELVALFEESALLICNDSGPMHVAAATDVPIVAIYGPSREARFGPMREENVAIVRGAECDAACNRHHCVTDYPCLMRTSTDDVVTAASLLLDRPVGVPS